jgi:uncharacterized protein YciI
VRPVRGNRERLPAWRIAVVCDAANLPLPMLIAIDAYIALIAIDHHCAARAARRASSVFVIELNYKADLSEIDAAMKAHVAWLDRHYAAGIFLLSGRKVPRDGGIIIACGADRAAIEAIVREDPFVARGLADARVIQFRASQRAEDLPARVRDP